MPVITTRWVAPWLRRDLAPPPCRGFLEADTLRYYHEAFTGLFVTDAAGGRAAIFGSGSCDMGDIARPARGSMRDSILALHSRAPLSTRSRGRAAGQSRHTTKE